MSAATVISAEGATSRARVRVKHTSFVDAALALCWVPFATIGWLLRDNIDRTAWFVSVTLLISFADQPLTIALVYGDNRTFNLLRRVFTWSPLLLVGAVVATQQLSLTTLAIVAGLWNAEHTLMQRYGIMRIYGRKAGQPEGRLDKAMLFAWLGLALAWIGADSRTPRHIEQAGLRGKNRRGLDTLADLQPAARVVLPFVIADRDHSDGALGVDRGPSERHRQHDEAILRGVDGGAIRHDPRQSRRRLSRIRRRPRNRVLHSRSSQRRTQVRQRRR